MLSGEDFILGANLQRSGERFKLAEGLEHLGERRFADLALEFLLHAVEGGDDTQSATLAVGLEREQVGARVAGIDLALQQPLGFERRQSVAQVAARSGKGLRQLRRLDLPRRLKEQRSQHESFKKAEAIGGEHARRERLKAPRRPVDGEHGAFAEKGVDTHTGTQVV